ncbi:helix-turn-helix transcriptional regulator [Crateriforma conspicua]|uniref:helix-turn-helix transcriptional regulator n=1 Tax=Crateriforma conspicua TaxID=2527996 RepID=UPI00118C5A18|nr:helix-turn-helix domain-containing protein [Crateriforma conspicua]QDV66100.1 Helix-turn-helix domain protein [Crateriforma conspicua]
MKSNLDVFFTIREVAEVLLMGPKGPYKLIKSGELPFVKIGDGSLRVLESDLARYICERRLRGRIPDRLECRKLDELGSLLRVREVAEQLKLGSKGPYKHIGDGELPHIRIGDGSIRVLESDLIEFVNKRRRGDGFYPSDDDDDPDGPGSPSLPVPKPLTQGPNGKHIRRDVA